MIQNYKYNYYYFTPAASKNDSVFSFMLVYRTHLGKPKTLNVGALPAKFIVFLVF